MNDFEIRIRQAEKALLGNHLARELIKDAEQVFFLYGSHGGPGFSDENYTLAEITTPTGKTHYFINRNGNYKAAAVDANLARHGEVENYRYVRRNKALEKVLEEAPLLLENEEAKQYLETVVGNPKEDLHYIAEVEIYRGELTGEPFSVVELIPRPETGLEENIYFSSFGEGSYQRIRKEDAERFIRIAEKELPPIPKIPRESRRMSIPSNYLTGRNNMA